MTDSFANLREQQTALDLQSECAASGFSVLSSWQAVQVHGDDAESFLQNLLTNDVKTAQPGEAQLSGFCQAKGRLLAVFWLLRRQDDFVLLLPADQADFLAQRLTMFKLRSKVEISPLSDHLLLAISGNIPVSSTAKINDTLAFSLVSAADSEAALAELEQTGLSQQSRLCWLQPLMRSGYPMIFAESRERFTPQQVNLDLAGGVSFRKGCYPGQEVVARLHYLGEAKRRLFLGEMAIADLSPTGSDIVNETGEVAGQLVQNCLLSDGRSLVQLSLKLTMAAQKLFLDNHEITEVQQLSTD